MSRKHFPSTITKNLHDTPRTRRGSSYLRLENAKTRRGLLAVLFASGQRQNMQFLHSDNAKTRRGLSSMRSRHRAPEEGHRFCVSTMPKHAEGCGSCDRTQRVIVFCTFFNEVRRLPPTLPRALKHFNFRRTRQIHHAIHPGIIHHAIHYVILITTTR